ncbi:MAG TPA: hypothetical protein VFN46_11165, partial [Acetobacteraceae bacterium]|nr:hypothetical protein [Acetobacteraceae bacterium]
PARPSPSPSAVAAARHAGDRPVLEPQKTATERMPGMLILSRNTTECGLSAAGGDGKGRGVNFFRRGAIGGCQGAGRIL